MSNTDNQTKENFNLFIRQYVERVIGAGLHVGFDKDFHIDKKAEAVQSIINAMPPMPQITEHFQIVPSLAHTEITELLEEINRLQEKYDENGYDFPPHLKLQRIEQHILALVPPTDTPIGYTVEATKVIKDLIKWIPDKHIAQKAIENATLFLTSIKQ